MTLADYIRLSWKRFWRSPNLSRNLTLKFFALLAYLYLALQFWILGWGGYYIILQQFPDQDTFLAFNRYIYIFIFISFSVLLMAHSFKPSRMKPFLLLPVKRRQIIVYHLIGMWVSPVLWILIVAVLLAVWTFSVHGYPLYNLLLWAAALIATLWIFMLLAWVNERSPVINFIMSLAVIGAVATIRVAPDWFAPLTDFYAEIYRGNVKYAAALWVLAVALWVGLIEYMRRNFYLDAKFKSSASSKITGAGLDFMDRWGMTGAFIRNDIRMILRNTRTKMILYSSLYYLLFAAFVYYAPFYRDNKFLQLFVAFTVTAVFLINYGSNVPAWDSEYYKLLMSGSIRYRDYLEAKWWLMFLSVWILLILSIPLIYFGKDIFKIILAFAFFNAGVTSYFVLWTGLFNTRPVKLNEKIQAFGGSQSFNAKLMGLSLLRLALPFAYFYLLCAFFDMNTVLWLVAVTGMAGIIFKDKILDLLSRMYNRRKYIMLEKFSKMEET